MRHRKKHVPSKNRSPQRGAILRDLVRALVRYGRVETTEARARSLRPAAERIITTGKKATLASHRELIRVLQSERLATKVIATYVKQYESRTGGYVRVLRKGRRAGDDAMMVIIEYV